jgi:hypothetical protein
VTPDAPAPADEDGGSGIGPGPGRLVFLAAGALVQLAAWLVLRPDLAGPQWQRGSDLELWLALEAVAALVIGTLASDRALVVRTVVAGWVLQAVHLIVFGEHYDDGLWGVGVVIDAVLAAVAAGLALLAQRLAGRVRGRRRT